jgi:hypothetical protein
MLVGMVGKAFEQVPIDNGPRSEREGFNQAAKRTVKHGYVN